MKKVKFYLDKSNTFKYGLDVEGVPLNEVHSRISIYMKKGPNMFFNTKIDESSGKCICTIPKLEMLQEGEGQMVVETVAGKTFFKLYECPVEFKQSVKVKMSDFDDKHDFFEFAEEEEISETKVSINIPTKEEQSEVEDVSEGYDVEPSNSAPEDKSEKNAHDPFPDFADWVSK